MSSHQGRVDVQNNRGTQIPAGHLNPTQRGRRQLVQSPPHLAGEATAPDYWANQEYTNLAYLRLLEACQRAVGDETLDLSLPWWFHTLSASGARLDRQAISRVDQVTIVTFNDTVAGIQMNAEQAAAAATAAGVPFRFASETNDIDVDWVTFFGQRNAEMLVIQNTVIGEWQSNPLFRGFAVHEYEGWSVLAAT